MFLFKKKKDTTGNRVEAEKAEVKKAAAPPVKVVEKSAKPSNNDKPVKGAPVRVVVPAGELRGNEPVKAPAASTGGAEQPQNPDEIADSLLVKVDPNPEIESAVDDAVVAAVLKPAAAPAAQPATAAAAKPAPTGADKPAAPASSPPAEAPKTDQATKAAGVEEKKPTESGKKAAEAEDKGNMFSNLFGKTEQEEESHLDRLIKSLPDVSIEEVVNEADEVKNLMNEWFQSQKR